mgnify:CR=1 FL=1
MIRIDKNTIAPIPNTPRLRKSLENLMKINIILKIEFEWNRVKLRYIKTKFNNFKASSH